MPISLERFNRLIEAAEAYLQRDRVIRSRLSHSCALVASGRLTPEAAIDEIALHLRVTPDYLPAEAVIIEERTRFQLTYKRSLYERHRAAARRAGIPPTPPAQFNSPRQLSPSESPVQVTPRIQAVIEDLNREAAELDAEMQEPIPTQLPEPSLTPEQAAEANRILQQLKRERGED